MMRLLFEFMNLYALDPDSYPTNVISSDLGDSLSERFSIGIKTQASHPNTLKYFMSGTSPQLSSKGVFQLPHLSSVRLYTWAAVSIENCHQDLGQPASSHIASDLSFKV